MIADEVKVSLPPSLGKLVEGYSWSDTSGGFSQTSTFRLAHPDKAPLYLKAAPMSHPWRELLSERDRLQWVAGKLPAPEVVTFEEGDDNEFLLITALEGTDAGRLSGEVLPRDIVRLLAVGLRMVHEASITECPFDTTLQGEIERVRFNVANGLVDREDIADSHDGMSAESLLEVLLSTMPDNEDLVFTHGDYCLPNMLIDGDRVSGFVDWSRAGVADRYKDIALVIRSMRSNLAEDLAGDFFDEYGTTQPDREKIEFYMLLDEFW